MQQYLPFTVLKQKNFLRSNGKKFARVATVLTVYGIETQENILLQNILISSLQQYLPFTVLKLNLTSLYFRKCATVATVLTVYGIETIHNQSQTNGGISPLQQYLPFTVLKLFKQEA